jgi:DNA-binding IclR family transcriptional regulator
LSFDSRPVRLTGSVSVDEDFWRRVPNASFLPLAELACSLGRLGKQHISYDDQLRELSVMDLALAIRVESQVIAGHGITTPCSSLRRSENARQAAFSVEWVSIRVSPDETHDRITSSSACLTRSICSSRTFT